MGKELLSDIAIRNTKPSDKTIRLNDGQGLHLLVNSNGSTWWRFDYTFENKRNTLSLGTYPSTSLAAARKKRNELKQLIANGIDPSTQRRSIKSINKEKQINENRKKHGLPLVNSFKDIADEWFEKKMQLMAESYQKKVYARLNQDVFPTIGNIHIKDVSVPDLLGILRRIEERGAIETAHRALWSCSQIIKYAIVTGRAEIDISIGLSTALSPTKKGNFAAITDPLEAKHLLLAIDAYTGSFVVKTALQLSPHFFVRPGELRNAKWEQFDFDRLEWRYLVSKTKTQHIVPLTTQTAQLLLNLKQLTGNGIYIFPSPLSPKGAKPISDMALLSALRRMGYQKDQMTLHGFRAMARTILDEVLKFRPDYIEHQLAHNVKDPLGRSYNRTTHLDERKNMMQTWSTYLENLKK